MYSDPPSRKPVVVIYVYAPQKKIWSLMKVTPIRSDMPIEPPEGDLGDLIVIHIVEGQVSISSTVNDEKAVFYIDLCKHTIMKDWFGEQYDND